MVKISLLHEPTVVIQPSNVSIWGATIINDEIFISQYITAETVYQIWVYSAENYSFKRSFTTTNVRPNRYGTLGTDGIDLFVSDSSNRIVKIDKNNGGVIEISTISNFNMEQTGSFVIDRAKDIVIYYGYNDRNIKFQKYSTGEVIKIHSTSYAGGGVSIYRGGVKTYLLTSSYASRQVMIADITNGIENLIFDTLYTSSKNLAGIAIYKNDLLFVGYGTKDVSKAEMSSPFLSDILLQSNNKIYSLETINTTYETKMTSNTAPAPLVASASSRLNATYEPYKAFNGTNTTIQDAWVTPDNTRSGWIQIDYGRQLILNSVAITSRFGAYETYSPKTFQILGSNDGTFFDLLMEVSNQINWTGNETRIFTFNNSKKYQYYRINVLENNGGIALGIGEILFSINLNSMNELPSINMDNFIKYGAKSINNFDSVFTSKNYILQDKVSEDAQGLWTTQLNRKPLSIKFD